MSTAISLSATCHFESLRCPVVRPQFSALERHPVVLGALGARALFTACWRYYCLPSWASNSHDNDGSYDDPYSHRGGTCLKPTDARNRAHTCTIVHTGRPRATGRPGFESVALFAAQPRSFGSQSHPLHLASWAGPSELVGLAQLCSAFRDIVLPPSLFSKKCASMT